tara:strand:+ start:13204 stop:13836 length:633 start_codon:yes stop_codon:yes gene_type:complete
MTSVDETQTQTTTVSDTEKDVKDYTQLSIEIDNAIKTCLDSVKVLKNIKKDLDKSHTRELKNCKKKKKSDKGNKVNKEPSGFNKPAKVPLEFCKQPWGCEEEALIPRTQLTKMVYDYIKNNNLQDKNDKRIIHPDKNVQNLFHLEKGQTLEFKTFQTHMATLYKKVKEAALLEKEKDVKDNVEEVEEVEVEDKKPKAKARKKAKKSTQKV